MARILITGGCGFIGANLALDRLRRGDSVVVLDNCSRRGTERNRDELAAVAATGEPLELLDADVRDLEAVAAATAGCEVVYHMAAQVAVTSSVEDPRLDFDVNALGTLNVLEAARTSPLQPVVVYASTNKVYGGLESLEHRSLETRYELPDLPYGVAETQPLDFHSPYGCSKGAADQYVLDYARIYGLRTVVFRQSCIYGPWQYGNEDQGWIAHFVLKALSGEGITVYGDGLQVRDALFVDDLLDAYDRAVGRIDAVAGRAFNVGGGPGHTVSLREVVELLRGVVGKPVSVAYGEWRPGDQRVYVSDIRRAKAELGWEPVTPVGAGIERLCAWLASTLEAVPA